jgi:hypothetical protein
MAIAFDLIKLTFDATHIQTPHFASQRMSIRSNSSSALDTTHELRPASTLQRFNASTLQRFNASKIDKSVEASFCMALQILIARLARTADPSAIASATADMNSNYENLGSEGSASR